MNHLPIPLNGFTFFIRSVHLLRLTTPWTDTSRTLALCHQKPERWYRAFVNKFWCSCKICLNHIVHYLWNHSRTMTRPHRQLVSLISWTFHMLSALLTSSSCLSRSSYATFTPRAKNAANTTASSLVLCPHPLIRLTRSSLCTVIFSGFSFLILSSLYIWIKIK